MPSTFIHTLVYLPVVAKREEDEGGNFAQLWGKGSFQTIAADVEHLEARTTGGAKGPELGPRGGYGAADTIVLD